MDMANIMERVATFTTEVGVLALIVAFGAAVVYGFEKITDSRSARRRKV